MERPLGEVEHDDGVLAAREQQYRPLALGRHLTDDRDRLVLETGGGDGRRTHRRDTSATSRIDSDQSSQGCHPPTRGRPSPARHLRSRAMPGTLVTLRHGQSTWNLENLFTGWRDVPLTAEGEAEAVAAGQAMAGGGAALRHVAHLGARARGANAEPRPRRDGPGVAAGPAPLAAQRAPLRRPAGSRQEADGRPPWCRAGQAVAAQLRRAAAARRPEQPRASRPTTGATGRSPRRCCRPASASPTSSPASSRTGRTSSPRSCSTASTCSSPPTATRCAPC